MNHETTNKNEAVYHCASCGKTIVVSIDESARAKHDFVDECPNCSQLNLVHIQVDGGSNVQVWVEGHSHDDKKEIAMRIRRSASLQSG